MEDNFRFLSGATTMYKSAIDHRKKRVLGEDGKFKFQHIEFDFMWDTQAEFFSCY